MNKNVTTFYMEMNNIEDFIPKIGYKESLTINEISKDAFQQWMLFVGVGMPWQWYSRLKWTIQEWDSYFSTTDAHTYMAFSKNQLIGYFELVKRDEDVEIKFFGLFPSSIGVGWGGALLSHAVNAAWELGAKKVWLHTCTSDHKAALSNYQARGFKIVNQTDEEEIIPDKEEYLRLANNFLNQYWDFTNPNAK
jgi:ribosomal protein S18 acetylase RimI-like enzyme